MTVAKFNLADMCKFSRVAVKARVPGLAPSPILSASSSTQHAQQACTHSTSKPLNSGAGPVPCQHPEQAADSSQYRLICAVSPAAIKTLLT